MQNGKEEEGSLSFAAPRLDPHQDTTDEPGGHLLWSLFKKRAHGLERLLQTYTMVRSPLDPLSSVALDDDLRSWFLHNQLPYP